MTLTHRKEAAGIERSVAPLRVFALIKELGTRVRCGVTSVNREPLFDLHAIAVAPREVAAGPIEVGTVFVGE